MKTTLNLLIATAMSCTLTGALMAQQPNLMMIRRDDDRVRLGPVLQRSEYLGLAIESHNGQGLKVAGTTYGSAAHAAGLEDGDIVVGAGGQYVYTLSELEDAARYSYGSLKLHVRDIRTGRILTTTLRVNSGVGNAVGYLSGLDVSVEMLYRGGLKIRNVERGSLAEQLGLASGDVLRTVDGQRIEDLTNPEQVFRGSFTLTYDSARTGYRMTLRRTAWGWRD